MGKKIIENGLFQHHTKETGKEQNHGIFCTCASKRPLSSHRNETICNYGQHSSLLLYTYSFYVYLQWASSVVFFLFSPTRQVVVQVFSLDREICCNLKRREQNKSDQFLSSRLHYIYFSIAGFMVYASFDRILVQKFFVPFGIGIPRRN